MTSFGNPPKMISLQAWEVVSMLSDSQAEPLILLLTKDYVGIQACRHTDFWFTSGWSDPLKKPGSVKTG